MKGSPPLNPRRNRFALSFDKEEIRLATLGAIKGYWDVKGSPPLNPRRNRFALSFDSS
jgi:hypothetical protein